MPELPHIPRHDTPGFQDLRTGPEEGPREMFASHMMTHDGKLVVVHPANEVFVGHVMDGDRNELRPMVRLHMAIGPAALLYVPTVTEMRAFAEALLTMADQEEAIANDAAAAAIARAMGKQS
jgi:hypothetical protein